MTAPISGTVLTAFSGLSSLEQQVTYLIGHCVSLQNAYNVANPTATQAKVAISPNYSTSVVTGQISFSLQPNTVEGTLASGVVAFLP